MKKLIKNNSFKTIFYFFLAWQLLIVVLVGIGEKYVPSTHSYIYSEGVYRINPPEFFTRANFDGMHYLDIARKGYGIYQQAFFPLYPKLIEYLTPLIGGRNLLAALTISWVSFFLALFLFYKLVRLDFEDKIAKRTIFYLLVFPTAFFFSSVYSESLFLFLVIGSFYFARTGKWWLAGILGAFASGTRLVGIFLLPALLIEWFEQSKEGKETKKDLISLVPIFLIPLGLLSYMNFLAINYNDPLKFIHVQSAFAMGRTTDKIVLLYQVFWRYLKMIMETRFDPLYFRVWLELITSTLFLILLFLGFLKKIRPAYIIFSILAFIMPTMSGTFLSMPRFVLTLFPGFMMLALIENRIFRLCAVGISLIGLAIFTMLFSQGYFVG